MLLDLKCWECRYVQPHSHYMSTSWGVGKGGVPTRTLGVNLTVSSFSPDGLQSWDLSCQVWSQTPLPAEPFLQYILSSLKTGFHFGMPHFICSTINRYRWFKILAELLDDMINLFKLFFEHPPYCFPQHLPLHVSCLSSTSSPIPQHTYP